MSQEAPPVASATSRFLDRAIDIGLGGVIFAAPAFMSGRHAIGLFVFVTLCAATFTAWTFRRLTSESRARWTGAEWIWLAAIGLVAAQLAPLSESLLHSVSPEIKRLMPLWVGESAERLGFAPWRQISLDPYSTRGALALLTAYAMLFTVAADRIRSYRDAERFVIWIGAAVGGYSLLALFQMAVSAENTLPFFDYPTFTRTPGARGAFPNPNHFGHFAALGAPALVMWIHSSWLAKAKNRHESNRWEQGGAEPSVRWPSAAFAAVLLALTVTAAIATFSRGAAIDLAIVVVVLTAILIVKRIADRRLLLVAGLGLALACAVIGWRHYERVSNELATLSGGIETLDNSGLRRAIWTANVNGGRAFSMFGAGAGSHREVYRAYLERHLPSEMSHAENGYLQIWLETGAVGVAILGAGILLGIFWLIRALGGGRERQRGWWCAAVAAAGLTASLVHSIYDFIWFVPACASYAILLLAVLCRVGRLHLRNPSPRSAFVSPRLMQALALGSLAVSTLMIHNRIAPLLAFPHWQAYLDLSLRSNDFDANEERRDDDVNPTSVADVERMIAHLERALAADPNFARAHIRLASLLERRFEVLQTDAENAMPLSQFRDAAFASKFPNKQAQEAWLSRAMGENRKPLDRALAHARRGLSLCPMHGEGYCHLSNTAFLEGHGPGTSRSLVEQARLVRPRHSYVLLTAGIQAATRGDLEDAKQLLKTVFHQEPRFQVEIVNLFGFTVPPAAMLELFEPDYDGLKTMYRFYRTNRIESGARLVGERYAREMERTASTQPARAAARNFWYAHQVFAEIGNSQDSLRCIRRACELTPRHVDYRKDLAICLKDAGRYDEADEEFQWCLRRSNDPALRELQAETHRLRYEPAKQARPTPQSRPLR